MQGIKNAKPFLKLEENLYIYDEKGNYTDEILQIFADILGNNRVELKEV